MSRRHKRFPTYIHTPFTHPICKLARWGTGVPEAATHLILIDYALASLVRCHATRHALLLRWLVVKSCYSEWDRKLRSAERGRTFPAVCWVDTPGKSRNHPLILMRFHDTAIHFANGTQGGAHTTTTTIGPFGRRRPSNRVLQLLGVWLQPCWDVNAASCTPATNGDEVRSRTPYMEVETAPTSL